jgi:hypothetical protein
MGTSGARKKAIVSKMSTKTIPKVVKTEMSAKAANVVFTTCSQIRLRLLLRFHRS